MPSLIFNLKKIKGANSLEVALKHNLRKISAEKGGYSGIESTRSHLNQVLIGGDDIDELKLEHQKTLSLYERKIRKDAVRVIEAVFSPSIDFEGDFGGLFRDSVSWLEGYLRIPVISAVIHNDEKLPHLHVLMVPFKDGRLSAKDIIGGRGQLNQTKNSYFKTVGNKYSLYNPRSDRRLTFKQRDEFASLSLDILTRRPELLTERRFELERAFKSSPLIFLEALGVRPDEIGI